MGHTHCPALWDQHNYENSTTQGAFTPQENHFSLLVSQQFQDPFLPAPQWNLEGTCCEMAPWKMTFTCFYRFGLGSGFWNVVHASSPQHWLFLSLLCLEIVRVWDGPTSHHSGRKGGCAYVCIRTIRYPSGLAALGLTAHKLQFPVQRNCG